MAISYGTYTITEVQEITITSTSVTYQKSTSGTTTPTGTWLDTIPSVGEGEYLWTKTVVTYSDSSETVSYSVSRNAVNGTNGNDGNTPTVTSTVTEYVQSDSGISTPTSGWSTTPPTAEAGKYIWTKVTVNYSDGNPAISYSVAKNGTNGIDGKDGGKWYSGTTITGTSTTATIFSGSGITSAVIGDMYLNTTTYNTYRCTLGGNASTAKWVYVNNIKGKGITSIQNQYYLSTSNTEQTGGSWSNAIPPYVENRYYWTKSHITWDDNTSTDTTPVLDNGLTDANANAIDARKVATNYLAVDNTGIMIADMEDGEQTPSGISSGKNVFIDSESVQIRNGQNTLSNFGNNQIVLGESNKSRLELSSSAICGITNTGIKNFEIINGDSGNAVTYNETGSFNNTSEESNKFNGTFIVNHNIDLRNIESMTVSVTWGFNVDGVHETSTIRGTINKEDYKDGEVPMTAWVSQSTSTRYYFTEFLDLLYDTNGFSLSTTIQPKGATQSIIIDSTATYSFSIITDKYQDASFTFGSRIDSNIGANSCVIGEQLMASSRNQVAIGRCNKDDLDKQYLFMVGNGISGIDRNNAFSVDWFGVAEAANLKLTESMIHANSEENFIKCTNINEDDVFTVSKTGEVNIADDLNVAGDINTGGLLIDGDISATGDIDSVTNIIATGDANVGGDLSVTGDVSITGDIDSVTNINATGNSTIGGASTITGKLTANGGIDVAGDIDVIGSISATNGDVSTTNDLTIGGDAAITGNTTIGGNTGITGNLNINGTITGNSLPLLKVQAFYWNPTINANSAFTSYGFDVTQSGYTALGVITFGVYDQPTGGRNSSWCVVPKCILWGGNSQTLDLYVWNQHPSQSAVVTVIVKVLYALPSII